jgi:ribosomal protein S18 acetylase RimI-like enzyme
MTTVPDATNDIVATLVAMTPDRAKQQIVDSFGPYREDLLAIGMTNDEAEQNITQNMAVVLPDGEIASNIRTLAAVVDGVEVGWVLLAQGKDNATAKWFIYQIEIDADKQGQGFGRATMQAIEGYVADHGGESVGLNVFGFNVRAKNLYESLGYQYTFNNMQKSVSR